MMKQRFTLRRRSVPLQPDTLPGAGAALPAAAVPPTALPRRVRGALERELCPGERVEFLVRPPGIGARQVRAEAPCWTMILATLSLGLWILGTPEASVFGALLLPVLLFCCGAAMRGWRDLAARSFQRQTRAYVVTNQRCFQLAVLGPMVQVIDLQEVPEESHLPAADVARLHLVLHDPSRARREDSGSEPAGRESVQSRLARLPQRLRERVDAALHPGERLTWLDRPGLRAYLYNAPVDLLTTVVATAGTVSSAIALGCLLILLLGSGGTTDALAALCGFGPLALASWALLAAHVRRRVRGTVYAVTDRRAVVLSSSGRLREVTAAELQRFRRVQDGAGDGNLAPGGPGTGFYGVRDVKAVDDLIKQRALRDRSTEVTPAPSLEGRGDELSPARPEPPRRSDANVA